MNVIWNEQRLLIDNGLVDPNYVLSYSGDAGVLGLVDRGLGADEYKGGI